MTVLAWSDDGALVQVFWSVEYCHSYEARAATAFAVSLTEPGTPPGTILISLLGLLAVLRMANPAPSMSDCALAGWASAACWTPAIRCSRSACSVMYFALRVTAAPLTRVTTCASAASYAARSAATVASEGVGFGNAALLVIALMTDVANAPTPDLRVGILRTAVVR